MAMDEFRALPVSDRQKLVENNGQLINRFKTSVCIQEESSCLTLGIENATRSGM